MTKRIVLAHADGPDTPVAVRTLRVKYQADVIALTLDLGQGSDVARLKDARDQALEAGALRAHVIDAREEFARGFILPSLKADALLDGRDPMIAALSRPLIARQLVDIAALEQASVVAHGCARSDKDHLRLDRAIHALNPALQVIPRDWKTERVGDRVNVNLWGRASEGTIGSADTFFALTSPLDECPDEAVSVDLSFTRGAPVAINGVSMGLVDLIASLTTIAGMHGVGRLTTVDARTLVEAPAAVVLHAAHRGLMQAVVSRDLGRFARQVSLRYVDALSAGQWFTPMRRALDAFVDSVHEQVTGVVRLQLRKGSCEVVACSSPFAATEAPGVDDGIGTDGIPGPRAASAGRRPFLVVR